MSGYENSALIWKKPGRNAGMAVGDNFALMQGDPSHGFISSEQGNVIKGNTHFVGAPHEFSFSGLWTFNPLLLSTVPSTIMTPMSVLVFNKNALSGFDHIAKSVSEHMSLLL